MGSMIHLTLGRIELDWGKNEGFQDHSALFRPGDLTTIPYYRAGDDEAHGHLPLITKHDGFSYRLFSEMQEGYSAPLKSVARRLLLLGHTEDYSRHEFEALRKIGGANHDFDFDELKALLTTADFSAAAFQEDLGSEDFVDFFANHVLAPKGAAFTSRLLLRGFGNPDVDGLSAHTIIRLVADNPTAQSLPVTWQFADVVDGGWVSRDAIAAPVRQESRFLIVTEGSADVQILKHALALLTPDLADFFDFVDMQEGYPFSGAGSLYNFVRGLISIKIQNNIVVVFDNDVEGVYGWQRCTALKQLGNMRLMRLPDLDRFKAFRTVGPSGEGVDDINGKAAAIECYLDIGHQPRVRWMSFENRFACYQGVIEGKAELQRGFLDQICFDPNYDYTGLEAILATLIAECVSITEAEATALLRAERVDV